VASNVYRIVQEALTNAEKHSGATKVSVRLWRKAAWLGVRIADNGKGFDVSKATSKTSGRLGLTNIQERVHLARGRLHLRSSPGRGTCLRLELPLHSPSPPRGDPR
jgi:signal transduction histidine kinase